ncbi:hypothetical protein [Flammeovirga sp. SubArs3]|uniref:hypothetical protein n=1 Tax=Flammeovirga sp. SubArs3 TaxID=2995316 RepID=UPI00248C553F|nr:hypothetical protein [Flammeovirga sp. SubArs3]
MLKNIVLTFILLYSTSNAFSQTDLAFEGLINSELEVRVRFSIGDDNKAEGFCIYKSTNEKVKLVGEKGSDGKIKLVQPNGERFEGKVIAQYMFKGEYFNKENVDLGMFLLSKLDESAESDTDLLSEPVEENSKKSTLSDEEIDQVLNSYIKEFTTCYAKSIDPLKCRQTTAKAITEIYNIDDFKDPYVGGSFLTMTEAYDKISADSQWKMIGEANATTLSEAQELANKGEVVVIAYPFKGFIQLAMIRRGETKMSSKWGMEVPNVGIFFYNDPEKSSASKPLNFIWRSPENIEIWVKK